MLSPGSQTKVLDASATVCKINYASATVRRSFTRNFVIEFKVFKKKNSAVQMKYYEENSAAMSEDDDNVDIESDVSVSKFF